MPVITVSRQLGTLGDEIARDVADRLKLRLMGSDMLGEVARRLGVPEARLSERDEREGTLVSDLVRTMRRLYPATIPPTTAEDAGDVDAAAYLQVIRQLIWEVARAGNAIIVGRGAAHVLDSNPDVLHVLLTAPLSIRVERVMTQENLSRSQAESRIKGDDASRGRYIRHYYGRNWLDVHHYNLMLDTAHFSQFAATSLICAAAVPDGADLGDASS